VERTRVLLDFTMGAGTHLSYQDILAQHISQLHGNSGKWRGKLPQDMDWQTLGDAGNIRGFELENLTIKLIREY
jgi:ribosomal protein L35AE/L33A